MDYDERSAGTMANSGMGLNEVLKKGFGDPRFYQRLEQMALLHSRKNKDYAEGGKQGHLGNFERTSTIKRLYPGFDWSSPFGTAMDFMLKQLDAAFILYAQKRLSVTDENVPMRLQDVSIYSVIGSLLWSDEQKEATAPKTQRYEISSEASGAAKKYSETQKDEYPQVDKPIEERCRCGCWEGLPHNPNYMFTEANLTQSILKNVEKFAPDPSTKTERPKHVGRIDCQCIRCGMNKGRPPSHAPNEKHEGWQFRECTVPSCNLCRRHRELNPSNRHPWVNP